MWSTLAWILKALGVLLVLIVVLVRCRAIPGNRLFRRDFDPLRSRKLQSMGPTVPDWIRYVLAGVIVLAGLAIALLDIPLAERLRRNGGGDVFWFFAILAVLALWGPSPGRKHEGPGPARRGP